MNLHLEALLNHSPAPWAVKQGPCGTITGVYSQLSGRPVCILGRTDALNPADVALIQQAPVLLAAARLLAAGVLDASKVLARGPSAEELAGAICACPVEDYILAAGTRVLDLVLREPQAVVNRVSRPLVTRGGVA